MGSVKKRTSCGPLFSFWRWRLDRIPFGFSLGAGCSDWWQILPRWFFLIIFLCVRKIPTEIICTRQKIYSFSCVYQKYRQGIYNFSVSDRNRQDIYNFSVGFIIFLSFFSTRQNKVIFLSVTFLPTENFNFLVVFVDDLSSPASNNQGEQLGQPPRSPIVKRCVKEFV